jgi:hypothetical protein
MTKFSQAAIDTRRRSIGRGLTGIGFKLTGLAVDLTALIAKDFLDDDEAAMLTKQVEGLKAISRNLGKLGRKLDK